jgi:predicted RNA-binding Zn-ribbon protein involved in translation (DUF1610 family)
MHAISTPIEQTRPSLETRSLYCPTCGTHVEYRDAEARPGVRYSCPVCGADVIGDVQTGALILASIADLP